MEPARANGHQEFFEAVFQTHDQDKLKDKKYSYQNDDLKMTTMAKN